MAGKLGALREDSSAKDIEETYKGVTQAVELIADADGEGVAVCREYDPLMAL